MELFVSDDVRRKSKQTIKELRIVLINSSGFIINRAEGDCAGQG